MLFNKDFEEAFKKKNDEISRKYIKGKIKTDVVRNQKF